MKLETAMACSGESVTTTMPLVPRVDSISADAGVGDEPLDRCRDLVGERRSR